MNEKFIGDMNFSEISYKYCQNKNDDFEI